MQREKILLTILSTMLLVAILFMGGCDSNSTELNDKFEVEIDVVDSAGNPVADLNMGLASDNPYLQMAEKTVLQVAKRRLRKSNIFFRNPAG